MSFAMDDISAIKDLQQPLIKDLKVTATDKKSNSDSNISKTEMESEKLVLSNNIDKKIKSRQDKDLQLQHEKNILETTKSGLDKIKGSYEKIIELAKEAKKKETSAEEKESIKSQVDEEVKTIKQTVEETSFNDEKPLKKENVIPEKMSVETKKDSQETIVQSEKILQRIQERQKQISEREEKIIKEVSSTIELESIVETIDYALTEDGSFEKAKEEFVEHVKTMPDKSLKIQITSFSKDMILALISISGGK